MNFVILLDSAVKLSVLIGFFLAGRLPESAVAGSVVAVGHSNRRTLIVKSYGLPQSVAQRHAVEVCHRLGGLDARLIASTDVIGECAIAIAHKGTGSVIGVSLGCRSATEAQARAIEQCRKAGGIDPVVKWGFRG